MNDLFRPPGMALIPAGSFTMGAVSGEFDADETPAHSVSLQPFCLDVTEVSVQAYSECKGCAPLAGNVQSEGLTPNAISFWSQFCNRKDALDQPRKLQGAVRPRVEPGQQRGNARDREIGSRVVSVVNVGPPGKALEVGRCLAMIAIQRQVRRRQRESAGHLWPDERVCGGGVGRGGLRGG